MAILVNNTKYKGYAIHKKIQVGYCNGLRKKRIRQIKNHGTKEKKLQKKIDRWIYQQPA